MRNKLNELRKRPIFAPLFVPAMGILVLALAVAWYCLAQDTTIVVVTRHAEKAAEGEDDPGLSEAGTRQARRLAALLADAGVRAIYTTSFRRTRETAVPLARLTNAPIETLDEAGPDDIARVVLDAHRGETVLVVGHGNTVPRIVEALGAGAVEPLDERAYGDVYVVAVPRFGETRLIRLKIPVE